MFSSQTSARRLRTIALPPATPLKQPLHITHVSYADGPNYPRQGKPPPPPSPPHMLAECQNGTISAGDKVDVQPSQGTKHVKICQRLAVTPLSQLSIMAVPGLCVQPAGVAKPGVAIVVAVCLPTLRNSTAPHRGVTSLASQQTWSVPPRDSSPAVVVHTASGLCVTEEGSTASLESCAIDESQGTREPVSTQRWVLGSGGRLCHKAGGCLSIVPAR